MEIHRKAIIAALLGCAVLSPSIHAGDKVHITGGSTSITVPKPNEVLKESERYRPYDSPSLRPHFDSSAPPIVSPFPGTSPQAEKKFREALDKEKNWIFVNPYKSNHDQKTDDFLKGEKNSALYNHPLMKDADKSVVDQYVDERKPDREHQFGPGQNSDSRSESRSDQDSERNQSRNNYFAPDKRETDLKTEENGLEPGKTLPPAFEKNPFATIEKNDYQKRLESSPLKEGIFGSTEKPQERTAYTLEEREARDAEFSKIYQPRLSDASSSSSLGIGSRDPIGTSIDPTRQELTPFSGRRTDQPFTPGAGLGLGQGNRSTVTFTGPPTTSPNSSFNSRSPIDFAPRAPQVSSFTPPSSAPSVSSSPSFNSQPFILTKPPRRF
ncbi:MAG TPA: hypothetical protein VF773_21025 [Verrucomicrobiae bacterium]